MAVRDISQVAAEYEGERGPQIIASVTGRDPKDIVISGEAKKIIKRGRMSSVFSLSLYYQDRKSGKEDSVRVLVKYFPTQHSRGGINFKDFARGTIDTSELLSGNGDFPSFYTHHTLKDVGTFLVLEQLGEETLHDELRDVQEKDVALVIQGVLPYLARFQINATRSLYEAIKSESIDSETYYSIFGKRESAKRIIDYIRATLGKRTVDELPKSLVHAIVDNTSPIQEIYAPRRDTFRVTHGDPISKNIIVRNHGSNSYGFIDAEPTLGDRNLDLSAILATPNLGLSPRDWTFLETSFSNADARELDESPSLNAMRGDLVEELEHLGVKFSNNEPPGNSVFYVYGGLFFRSARINAKVNDLKNKRPELYKSMLRDDPGLETTQKDMRRNMSLSLGKIVANPERFDISRQEYVEKLTKLHEIMGNEGVIGNVSDYEVNNSGGGNGDLLPKIQEIPSPRNLRINERRPAS